MNGSVMDAEFPAGKFDKYLMVSDGNRQMYEVMGEYVYSPLYKMVCDDDVRKLSDALADCDENESVNICVRLIGDGGEYEKFILDICKCADEDKFMIEFQNVSVCERRLKKISEKLSFLRDFLTVGGQFYFMYRPQDNHFYMFWMDYEQEVVVFDDNVDEWAERMVREGFVVGQDKVVFDAFCQALCGADRSQSFTFHGSILTKGGNEDAYKVRFVPRSREDGNLVLGVWTIVNERTGNEIDDYVAGTYVDALTDILNKRAITDYAVSAVAAGEKIALIMMDIDNFKEINDTYGHLFGDQVIAATAGVIKKVIGEGGVAGRMGGDEFMIVLKDFNDELDLRNYLRGIKLNIAALFQDRLGSNRITCSIGAARSDTDGGSYKDLFRIADKALYIAKQKGKNRYIIYKKEKHGQFNISGNDYDMVEIRDSFYAEKDLLKLNELLSETVLHGSSVLPQLLKHAAYTLTVDRMIVTWGRERSVLAVHPAEDQWEDEELKLFESDAYRELFQGDMLTITNTNMLEYSMPDIYAVFRKNNVLSVMQHILRDENGGYMGMVIAQECVNLKHFPKLAVQLFENMCRIVNAVLIKETLDN